MRYRFGLWVVVLATMWAGSATDLAAADPVEVTVDGRLMRVNSAVSVPRGMFGLHAHKLTEANVAEYGIDAYRQIHFGMSGGSGALDSEGNPKPVQGDLAVYIDCMGDRYYMPPLLGDPDYAERMKNLGRSYGEVTAKAAEKHGYQAYVEFWNEPYLNWASRSHGASRNVYNPKWYKQELAEHEGKVTLKWADEPLEHLRWRKYWAKGEDGKIYYGVEIPEGLEPGDTFRGHSPKGWYFTNTDEQTFTVVEQWGIYDPTQTSFWSGQQNLDFYLKMFKPWAEALHEANPEAKILAGWDFGFSHGDWSVFENLIAPTIDATIDHIEGVTEHHYGGNTRAVAGWYEVATAYAMSKHGKWIRGYNTETAGHLDPAVHGEIEVESDADKKHLSSMTYALRDILELIHRSPDKAGSRTAHHPDAGVLGALKFLKDLDGPLLHTAVTRTAEADNPIWPVATVHDERLVVVVFNNAIDPRDLALRFTPPTGTRFVADSGQTHRLQVAGGEVHQRTEPIDHGTDRARFAQTLPPLTALKWTIDLAGGLPGDAVDPSVHRQQFFANEGVLHEVEPGESVTLSIDIPAAVLDEAESAFLRLVVDRDENTAIRYTLNGDRRPNFAGEWTVDLAVDPAELRSSNTLTFTAPAGEGNGYRIAAASLVVDEAVKSKGER